VTCQAAFGRIHVLEEMGGSLVGGAIKLIQDRKKNPVERDADLPPKPAGQTVASYQQGLKTLPEAIAKQIHDKVRVSWVLKGIGKCQEGYELTYDTPDGVAKVTPPHTPFTTR
jgi:oxygen-dependent protoporphyrinogen oxidase